jgi:hypothetical protein
LTAIIYCQQAKDLLDVFVEAVRELIRLHQDQFEALLAGDPDSQRFDDLIHMANERKRRAKYAYMHHVEIHGCSTEYGID